MGLFLTQRSDSYHAWSAAFGEQRSVEMASVAPKSAQIALNLQKTGQITAHKC